MIYLSQLVGNPVLDVNGEKIGTVSDLGIATKEVFPRVTSLAFMGPGKTPFMISWRKYVESYDEHVVHLKVSATDIRFSYLQSDEVLIARDILNKQIVDTQGMRVVRVNDLKLSDTSSSQLRLLGADVGARGLLRTFAPLCETIAVKVSSAFGKPLPERLIAWSYMNLVDRNLSDVQLSVTHKTLDDMHPADIADIIERLDPRLRGQVFAQLDDEQRANAMAEFDDDHMAVELMGGMAEMDASRLLSAMDPDDAAELVSELDYDKAEKLLRLMGVKEQHAIRQLLGYRDETAGRIMTSEVVALPKNTTVAETIAHLRTLDEDFEAVRYIYLNDAQGELWGVVPIDLLVISDEQVKLGDLATRDLIVAHPDDDQEDVALNIAKYNLLAIPVVNEKKELLGIVTVDDALDVLEEEHAEDLQIAGASQADTEHDKGRSAFMWMLRRNTWVVMFALVAAVCTVAACEMFARVSGSVSGSVSGGVAPAVIAGLLASLSVPAALIITDDALSYTTSIYLEYDADDEDAPSALGFSLKMIALGIAFAAAFVLFYAMCGELGGWLMARGGAGSLEHLREALLASMCAAGVSIVVSLASMPAYLARLRSRDAHNKDSNGWAMSNTAMGVCAAVFMVVFGVALGLQLGVM